MLYLALGNITEVVLSPNPLVDMALYPFAICAGESCTWVSALAFREFVDPVGDSLFLMACIATCVNDSGYQIRRHCTRSPEEDDNIFHNCE